jgi:membrane protein DedA with SNARE-associated domain
LGVLDSLSRFLIEVVGGMGYLGIFILMTIESSFNPFTSEIVMIPAGYMAQKGEMNLFGAILLGALGSLLGAFINYGLAFWLGRPFFEKYGKYFFVSKSDFDRACRLFKRYGKITTFVGRLLPAIRHLISLPAGLASMGLTPFTLYTLLGAGLWVSFLAGLGYFVGDNERLVRSYLEEFQLWVFLGLGLGVIVYVGARFRRVRRGGLALRPPTP